MGYTHFSTWAVCKEALKLMLTILVGLVMTAALGVLIGAA